MDKYTLGFLGCVFGAVFLTMGIPYVVVNGFPDLNPFSENDYAPSCNLDLMQSGDKTFINGQKYMVIGISESYGSRAQIDLIKVTK